MYIYTYANLDTYEIFTIKADNLEEADKLASKVCDNFKAYTRNRAKD